MTQRAKELLFSARKVEAEEAASIGLLNCLVPLDRLMDETLELAQAIARNPPDTVQAATELVHDHIGMLSDWVKLPDIFESSLILNIHIGILAVIVEY